MARIGTESLYKLVHALVRVMWTIVGFFYWIPRIIYSGLYFMTLLVAAGFTEIEINEAEVRLHRALDFYPDAFERIDKALSAARNRQEMPNRPLRLDLVLRVSFETVVAAATWLALPILCVLSVRLVLRIG